MRPHLGLDHRPRRCRGQLAAPVVPVGDGLGVGVGSRGPVDAPPVEGIGLGSVRQLGGPEPEGRPQAKDLLDQPPGSDSTASWNSNI